MYYTPREPLYPDESSYSSAYGPSYAEQQQENAYAYYQYNRYQSQQQQSYPYQHTYDPYPMAAAGPASGAFQFSPVPTTELLESR